MSATSAMSTATGSCACAAVAAKSCWFPLPPAVGRAIDQAGGSRFAGPILLTTRGRRMDRHPVTRRLKHLADFCGLRMPPLHPHMLRHTFVTTMLDTGVSLWDVQVAARHADPRTTMRYDRPARTSTATRTTSSPPTWPQAPDLDEDASERTTLPM